MGFSDYFDMMARYNQWANNRLYEAARRLTDEDYRRDLGAFFGSVHGTLNHILVADRIWMRRFTGEGTAPDNLNVILFDSLACLGTARAAEDARIIAHVDDLAEENFLSELSYRNMAGVPRRQMRAKALAHFFNHQTHHRGQVHALLSRLGLEPPALDLIYAPMAGVVVAEDRGAR